MINVAAVASPGLLRMKTTSGRPFKARWFKLSSFIAPDTMSGTGRIRHCCAPRVGFTSRRASRPQGTTAGSPTLSTSITAQTFPRRCRPVQERTWVGQTGRTSAGEYGSLQEVCLPEYSEPAPRRLCPTRSRLRIVLKSPAALEAVPPTIKPSLGRFVKLSSEGGVRSHVRGE